MATTTSSTAHDTCYEIDQALGLLPDANQQLLDQEQQGTLDGATYLWLLVRRVRKAQRHLEWRVEQLKASGEL